MTEEFERQFECLRENTEKCRTSSVLIKKELENGKTISYSIKFIDNSRFMSSSLSSRVDNLFQGLHNIKCMNCNSCLEYNVIEDVKKSIEKL